MSVNKEDRMQPFIDAGEAEIKRLRNELKTQCTECPLNHRHVDAVERYNKKAPNIRSLIATAYQEVREFEDYSNALSHMLEAIDLLENLMGYSEPAQLQEKDGE